MSVVTRDRQDGHRNSPLVGIVNILETDVLFILEQTVKLGMVSVETELGEEKRRVRLDEWSVPLDAVTDSSTTGLEPAGLAVCLFECLRC